MNEARGWLVVGLQDSDYLYYEKKFLLFYSYYLTEKGKAAATYFATRLNSQLQGDYHQLPSDFPQFHSETHERNIYIVSQLLLHISGKRLKKCANVSA